MSGTLPPLFVELKANVSEFTAKMGEARGEVEHLANKGSSGLDQMATVGKAAFFGLAAAAVGFGAASLKVGVEQEEANARLTTALHNTGSAMTALSAPVEEAETKMRRLGFTNGDTTDALAKLTNATHDPAKALGDLGLAADIARARNIDLSTATDLLAKVETGHVSLLGRIGIETKDATGKTISQEEAVRKLSEMYGGQASAYSQTFAGKMATLKAEVEGLQEKIGMWLIPKIEALVSVGSGAIEWADKHRVAAEALATLIAGPLVAAMGVYIVKQGIVLGMKVVDFFTTAGSAAIGFVQSIGSMITGTQNMGLALAAGSLAIAGVAAGIGFLIMQMNAAQQAANTWARNFATAAGTPAQQVDAIRSKIAELQADLDSHGTAAHIPFVRMAVGAQQTEDKIKALKGQLAALTANQEGHKKAAEDGTAALADEADAADQTAKNVSALASQTGYGTAVVQMLAQKLGIDLSKASADAGDKIMALGGRLQVASPYTLALQDAMAKLSDKTADAKEKVDAFRAAVDLVIGATIPVEQATMDFRDKLDALGKAAVDNGRNLDINSTAGRANTRAIEDAVVAAKNQIEAMAQQGYTSDQVKTSFLGQVDALKQTMLHAGYTKDQVDQLLTRYNMVPSALNTYFGVNTGAALGAIEQLYQAMMTVAQPVEINFIPNVGAGGTRPNFQYRAAGGSVGPGDYVVGEEGPEFMHIGPDGRGYIRNAGQTRAMMGSPSAAGGGAGGAGGGVTIVVQPGAIVVQGSVTSERDLVDVIHDGLLVKGQRVGSLFGSYA